MDAKKLIKTAIKVAPFVTATVGIFSLALSKYEEKQENFSREFPEIENELKQKINEVRNNGN
ncbi:MAG: hypothetical protein J6Q50_00105 [Clostridia bacterium]|nr:hypothetical protein [Clostridia bacterium]